MEQFLLGVISAVGLGVFGWIAVEFIGRPVRDFLDLRSEVREETLRLAYSVTVPKEPLRPGWSEDQQQYEREMAAVREAQNVLRILGIRAMAFGETEWAAAKVLRLMRLAPIQASEALIALSDEYDQHGRDHAAQYAKLAKAMRYPF